MPPPPRAPPASTSSRPVKAPRSWPNTSLSRERLGDRGAVEHAERRFRAGARLVNQPREERLANAGLPFEERHGVRAGQPLGELRDLVRGGGVAEEAVRAPDRRTPEDFALLARVAEGPHPRERRCTELRGDRHEAPRRVREPSARAAGLRRARASERDPRGLGAARGSRDEEGVGGGPRPLEDGGAASSTRPSSLAAASPTTRLASMAPRYLLPQAVSTGRMSSSSSAASRASTSSIAAASPRTSAASPVMSTLTSVECSPPAAASGEATSMRTSVV